MSQSIELHHQQTGRCVFLTQKLWKGRYYVIVKAINRGQSSQHQTDKDFQSEERATAPAHLNAGKSYLYEQLQQVGIHIRS